MNAGSELISTLRLPPDRTLSCSQCGIRFVWTGWEQQQAANTPECCPGCRALRLFTQRRRGVVKWYAPQKGYGFITASDGSEVFVHRRALGRLRSLRRGQVLAFRVEPTPSGPQAVDIRRIGRHSQRHRQSQPPTSPPKS